MQTSSTRCAPRAMATTSSSVTQIFRPRRPRARPCWGRSSAPSAARRCDAGEQNNEVLATGERPVCADIVAKVENRTTQKISRKLIFGLLCGCDALYLRYGYPLSILDETIWSLTSPCVKRISGSKNFRSSPQKDFCNNIGTFETCRLLHAMSAFDVAKRFHPTTT